MLTIRDNSNNSIVSMFWLQLLLCFLLLFSPSLFSAEILPIGVRVELSNEITVLWPPTSKDEIVTQLSDKLIAQLNNKQHPWQFVGSDLSQPTAQVVLRTISRGANEVLLEMHLEVYSRTSPPQPARLIQSIPLDQALLYKPGHFIAHGRPEPGQAAADIWDIAEQLIQNNQASHLSVLSQIVPVAIRPSAFNTADNSLVLPLPRDRYASLSRSVFRLDCVLQAPLDASVQLISEARNQWAAYDSSRPQALKVTVKEPPTNLDLATITAERAYLEKLNADFGWLFTD